MRSESPAPGSDKSARSPDSSGGRLGAPRAWHALVAALLTLLGVLNLVQPPESRGLLIFYALYTVVAALLLVRVLLALRRQTGRPSRGPGGPERPDLPGDPGGPTQSPPSAS